QAAGPERGVLDGGDQRAERQEEEPDAQEESKVAEVHPTRRGHDRPPRAPTLEPERRRRLPLGARGEPEQEREDESERDQERRGIADERGEHGRARRDGTAEEAGRRPADVGADRDREALVAP